MLPWRILELEVKDSVMNMAIDEAILTARANDRVPNTLRFYQWKPSAVTIGKNQTLANEVQLDNCQNLGVATVRRISGGGAVYHDEKNEVTYSLTANMKDLGIAGVIDAYGRIYSGIRDALRILGVTADFREGDAKNCPNLTVNGKKISGSAQAYKQGIILQHGTLLLDVDFDKMFSVLRVPWARDITEVIGVAKNKITSLKGELGHQVSAESAVYAATAGFRNALGVQMVEGDLTEFEMNLAQDLCRDKYTTDDWNLNRKSLFS